MNKELKDIIENMWDEVSGAKHYAKMAVSHKGTDEAMKYGEMARQELGHLEKLETMAAKAIEHDPIGKEIYEWEHERIADKMASVKIMLDMTR